MCTRHYKLAGITALFAALALSACGSSQAPEAPVTNATCALLDKEGAPAAFNSLSMMGAMGMSDTMTDDEARYAVQAWRDQTEAELNVCPQYRDAYHAWLHPSVRP